MSVLNGKTCLITGGSGGLGEALAREFGRAGCRVLLSGSNREKLQTVTQKLSHSIRLAGSCLADLTLDREIENLIKWVQETTGTLDILINNAGVFPVGGLTTMDVADIDACLNINMRAPLLLCRAFAAGMRSMGWGRIVNIASSSAYAGFANTAAYCASKHGLLGLSRALDDELRPQGIRVIALSPGSIQTPMGRNVRGQTFDTFLNPAEIAAMCAHVAALDGNMVVKELRLDRMVIA